VVDVFVTIDASLGIVSLESMENTDYESATEDCTAHLEALALVLFGSERADCQGERRKAISKEKNRP
jgi:hypothetical protein